jgi:hypothetical protein
MTPSSVSACANPIAPAIAYPTCEGSPAPRPAAGCRPDSVVHGEIPGAYVSRADFWSGVSVTLLASGILWVAIGLVVRAVMP